MRVVGELRKFAFSNPIDVSPSVTQLDEPIGRSEHLFKGMKELFPGQLLLAPYNYE